MPAPTKIRPNAAFGLPHRTTNVSSTRHISSSGEIMLLAESRKSPIAPKMFSLRQNQRHQAHHGTSPSAIRRSNGPDMLTSTSTGLAGQKPPESVRAASRCFPARDPLPATCPPPGKAEMSIPAEMSIDNNPACTAMYRARPRQRKMVARLRDRQAQRAQQHHQRHGDAHAC